MLKKLNETDAIDQIILKESRNLDTLIFYTPIWISDQVASQYDLTFGVIINKDVIIQKINENNLSNKEFIIRLVIAHEKMHARQIAMMRITSANLQSLPIDLKKQLECQADLCAGFVAFFPRGKQICNLLFDGLLSEFQNFQGENAINNTMNNFTDEDLKFAKNILLQNKEAIHLFFELGENEGQFGSHPDPQSREMAFEIGYDAFIIQFLNTLLPSKSNILSPTEWQFFNQVIMLMGNAIEIMPVDYFQGVFFDSWSYRTAFKITHYLQEANKNVIFKVTESRWNTSAENPLYYFKMEVHNNNADSVLINMSILIKQVSRTDKDNPFKSKIVSSWPNLFKLGPGEVKRFNDSTLWFGATDTTMPKVFFPGERGSLYFSTVLDKKIEKNYFSSISSTSSMITGSISNDAERLIRHLTSIQRQFASKNISELKNGAGLQWFDDEISYCTFIDNESFNLKIPIKSDATPYLSKTIFSSNELYTATNKLKTLANKFKEFFSDYQVNYHDEKDFYPYVEISDDSSRLLFTLSIKNDYRAFNIILEIEHD